MEVTQLSNLQDSMSEVPIIFKCLRKKETGNTIFTFHE